MSISRKNWSALSSLTRQWTMEDEEEVERERRRKVRTYSTETGESPTEDMPPVFSSSEDASESVDPEAPVDFVEMLRVRDERRRRRHVETLRRQREEEEKQEAGHEPKAGGDTAEPAPVSASDITEKRRMSGNSSSESSQDTNTETPAKPSRMFVSSLSISMDKSPMSPTERRVVSPLSPTSPSGRGRLFSPISPTSPTGSGRVVSPISCTSPTGSGRVVSPLSPTGSSRSVSSEESIRSPAPEVTHPVVQNGDTLVQASQNGSSGKEGVITTAQTEGAPFPRQTTRARSFRMERKKEESTVPFQRSASVRITTKTQASKAPNLDEDKDSPFQRNSKQRISSRSIQEKMERLAMAAQKSENVRSPSSQKGMYVLMDEVTRKRGLFERDPAAGDSSTGAFSKDFRNFSAGISERLNRWVTKAHVPGSIFSSSDLRNVDIASKRNIWEHRAEEASPKASPNSKVYK
ncbi:hypothetical protein AGOR_G00140020 [Albula goreensis]|uniref:Ladinin-1 n=1 Tax=Albula goreensis TaxID=1534307 RepID=A0A8T3D659_9TELE|nr:hypothetical protein AGOR_G00140020 [Albula goreensis]